MRKILMSEWPYWLAFAVAYVATLVFNEDILWRWACVHGNLLSTVWKDAQTILWAPFTAVAAWLGLVITKEQKTSEFRQAWIDKLREDFASLFASAASMNQKMQSGASVDTFYDKYSDFLLRVSAIRLRLNPIEQESKNVLQLIEDAPNLLSEIEFRASSNRSDKATELRAKLEALLMAANVLLKEEWKRVKRVKRGEPIFVATGRFALGVLIGLGFPSLMVLLLAPACT